MANEVTETQQKDETLTVSCAPSLKAGLKSALVQAGFRTITDGIQTFARDLIAGRIQYKDGILQSQGKTT